jgi:hypothetical protein
MVRAGSAALLALACATAVPGSADPPVVVNGRVLSQASLDPSRLDDPAGGSTRTAFPWVVQHGDFSADGARLAFDDGGELQIRNTDGTGHVFPDGTIKGQITAVRFTPGDAAVLVASRTVDDLWSVHRVAPGQAPVTLWEVDGSTTFHDVTAVEVDDVTGRILVVDDRRVWVVAASGATPTEVAPTSCTSACPDFVYGATWAPDGRLLVLSSWFDAVDPYAEHLEVGTYDPTLRTLTRLRSLPSQGQWRSGLIVSPDGAKVAWNVQDSPADWTAVASLTGSEVPVRLAGPWHVAWQPCPDGVCPTFRLTPRPGRPGIGRASSGAVGGRVTMTARWVKPANAVVARLDSWKIIIAMVNSANRVTNTNVDIVQNPNTLSKVLHGYGRSRFKFRVRVRGEMGWSAYSPWSNIVRGR